MEQELSLRYKIPSENIISALIYHELGHMLNQFIIVDKTEYKSVGAYEEKWYNGVEEQSILESLFQLDKEFMKENITWYAVDDYKECFAELIAESMISSTPREPARKLKEYLIKEGYFKEF